MKGLSGSSGEGTKLERRVGGTGRYIIFGCYVGAGPFLFTLMSAFCCPLWVCLVAPIQPKVGYGIFVRKREGGDRVEEWDGIVVWAQKNGEI